MGTFQSEHLSDRFMLNQMTSLSGRDQVNGEEKRLVIRCRGAENKGSNSLTVTCLGGIPTEHLLLASLSIFKEVILRKGDCSRCLYKEGEKLLAYSLAATRAVWECIGSGAFPIRLEENEGRNEEVLNRRDLFLKITNKVRNKTVSLLDQGDKVILNNKRHELNSERESHDDKRPSHVRELLGKLIEHKAYGNDITIKYEPEYPWADLKIDGKKCNACGTCIQICPTGAITEESEDGHKFIYFNSSLCTNCSLCGEACLNKVIDFEEGLILNNIFQDKDRAAAEITLTACSFCGDIIKTGTGKLCPTCDKRQVQPMFVKH